MEEEWNIVVKFIDMDGAKEKRQEREELKKRIEVKQHCSGPSIQQQETISTEEEEKLLESPIKKDLQTNKTENEVKSSIKSLTKVAKVTQIQAPISSKSNVAKGR